MEYILETKALGKKYRNFYALRDINMKIKKGDIYGFIGKNGAGKTTLIKLITGLVKLSEGEIKLFGSYEKNKIIEARKRIGTLIETPAYYSNMTAYENMETLRIQRGIPGKQCILDKLKLVGLDPMDKKVLSEYSLGMKQKLGIAMALLGNPEFLILDEPTNGLDPMGVVTIRELLKKLNKDYGITILISSHLLSELYQLATCYGIINDGNLLEEISQKDLDEKCKKAIEIKVSDSKKATLVLETILKTHRYKVLQDNIIKIYDCIGKEGEVAKALTEGHILIYEMKVIGDDLESYFIKLIGGELND